MHQNVWLLQEPSSSELFVVYRDFEDGLFVMVYRDFYVQPVSMLLTSVVSSGIKIWRIFTCFCAAASSLARLAMSLLARAGFSGADSTHSLVPCLPVSINWCFTLTHGLSTWWIWALGVWEFISIRRVFRVSSASVAV